jgi:hypothetical protein
LSVLYCIFFTFAHDLGSWGSDHESETGVHKALVEGTRQHYDFDEEAKTTRPQEAKSEGQKRAKAQASAHPSTCI